MPDNQITTDALFRSRLARTLTTWSLCFLLIIALVALIGAGIYSYNAPPGHTPEAKERATFFFDLVKYLLATILPVVAGWVGTVLAFYYGKENFEAGTKSVTIAARALTTKEKLAGIKVNTLGIARSEFNALVLNTADTEEAKKTDLGTVKDEFRDKKVPAKLYERLPILLKGDVPYMVLHRSTLNAFLVEANEKDPKKSTLGTLCNELKFSPNDSFVAVASDATADQAKTEMENIKNCSDVFVTTDGKKTGAVTRWITNVDLLEKAEIKAAEV